MARKIDDYTHMAATRFINRKYTTHADERQRAMGLSYVTAGKEDLICEVAAFARSQISEHFSAMSPKQEALAIEISARINNGEKTDAVQVLEWAEALYLAGKE